MTQSQFEGLNPRSFEYGDSFTYSMTSTKWECAQPETRTSFPSTLQEDILKNILCNVGISTTAKDDYDRRIELFLNRVIISGSQRSVEYLNEIYEDSTLVHLPPKRSTVLKVKINETKKGSIKHLDTSTIE